MYAIRSYYVKADRNAPSSVRDLVAQMLGQIARMGGVAGTAGPSSLRHIHVQVMKVQRSVPEIGQALSFLNQNNVRVVTGKAEGIDRNVEWGIEFRRILPDKQPEIVASVRSRITSYNVCYTKLLRHITGPLLFFRENMNKTWPSVS